MDTPSSSSAPAQSAPNYVSPTRANATGILIGGIVLIIIAAALVFLLPYLQRGAGSSVSSFAFAAGPLPGSALSIANVSTASSTPLTVSVEGKQLHALDALRAQDGTWYFILNEGGTSNLYKKGTDGTIARLTHSSTAKFNLSFDQTSGRLAYQALTPPTNGNPSFLLRPDWNVTLFDQRNSMETVVATGTDPFLISGGTQLLVRKGNALVLQTVGQKTSASVLALPSAVYALNPEGTMITVYNPVTNSLDRYTFTHGFAPNYTTSIKMKSIPSALGYVDGELMAAYRVGSASDVRFIFMPVGSEGGRTISLPTTISGAPQRIYSYE